jgi:hypothetical protein
VGCISVRGGHVCYMGLVLPWLHKQFHQQVDAGGAVQPASSVLVRSVLNDEHAVRGVVVHSS